MVACMVEPGSYLGSFAFANLTESMHCLYVRAFLSRSDFGETTIPCVSREPVPKSIFAYVEASQRQI
jgi:hypothetical protein